MLTTEKPETCILGLIQVRLVRGKLPDPPHVNKGMTAACDGRGGCSASPVHM